MKIIPGMKFRWSEIEVENVAGIIIKYGFYTPGIMPCMPESKVISDGGHEEIGPQYLDTLLAIEVSGKGGGGDGISTTSGSLSSQR